MEIISIWGETSFRRIREGRKGKMAKGWAVILRQRSEKDVGTLPRSEVKG